MATQPGTRIDRRALLASGAIVLTGGAVWAFPLRPPAHALSGKLATIVPDRLGAWQIVAEADPVLPDIDEQRTIEAAYEDVLARTYRNRSGDRVMLVIARSRAGSGLLFLHRPEICYAAQGFSVLPFGKTRLPPPYDALSGEELLAVRGERHESILYWGTVAGHPSEVGIMQKLLMLRAAWKGEALDGYLVRISAVAAEGAETFAMLRRFAQDLIAGIPQPYRSRLGGTGAGP
jgi:EpsI family protein